MSGHAVPTLTLTLFGGFEARTPTGALLSFRTTKERALVAYLALESDAHHSRSKLATLFWGDSGEGRSRDSLRHALGDVRRALSSLAMSPLTLSGDGVALDRDSLDVDVARFHQFINAGSSAAVQAAVDLYRGDLLDGLVIDEEPFERWLAQRRETLRACLLHALEKDLVMQLEARRPEQAMEAAQRVLRFDGAHEEAHRALMRLYDERGQRASALRQYRSCAASLELELGAAPDRQTRALRDAILRAEPGCDARRPTACDGARDNIVLNGHEKHLPTPPPFDCSLVGRADEIALLRAAADAAALGSGGCVFLVGETGVGKTRLAWEATLGIETRARVLRARAFESERGYVLGVWADVLRSALGGGCDISVARLDPVWIRELARLLPELGRGEHQPVAHAEERWLFEAVMHFLSALAADRAAVVVIDDLHWADDASVRLLAFLARRIAASHILMIAALREEEVDTSATLNTVDALTSVSCARLVDVKPLPQAHTLELFDRMTVGEKPTNDTAQARTRIWELSRGSPFMVVEAVRAMREGISLNAFAAGDVPDSIRRVVGTRVRHLPVEARALLAIAAAIGCEFDFALIVRVAALEASDVASALEQLVRRRMLQVTDDRLGFTHAWIRDSVYESLLPPRRQLLHLEIARAYEATTAASVESLPATLAHHYAQAKAWAEAAANARLAGEHALRRFAYAEAATLFATTRFALEQLPRDAHVAHDIVDILVKLHRALVPTGRATPIIRNLGEAEALSAQANDPAQRAAVLLCGSEYARWTGDYAAAIQSGERGLSAAVEARHTLLVAEARFHLGMARFWKGHYRAAISTLRRSALGARQRDDAHRSGNMFYAVIGAREFLALALASIGQFTSARKVADEAIAIAATLGDPLREVAAARGLDLMLVEKGDFDTAIPRLERTLACCEREHLELLYSLIAGTLGYAYAITGRAGEGAAMIDEAIARREALRGAYPGAQGAYLHSRLAEACIMDERIDAARGYVERVADFARRYDNRVDEAWSLRLSGDLAVRGSRRDVEAAEGLYLRSRAIAARLSMAPFVAHCDRRIAGLAAVGLDNERSRAALERARDLYSRLAMPHWLARTQQIRMRAGDCARP